MKGNSQNELEAVSAIPEVAFNGIDSRQAFYKQLNLELFKKIFGSLPLVAIIFAAGEMDRNVSMLGGLAATQNFKAQGIANLKENIDAAYYLIENNYPRGHDKRREHGLLFRFLF